MKQSKSKILVFATFSIVMVLAMSFAFAEQLTVDLGKASHFAILTSIISNNGDSAVIGDIGVDRNASIYITGFSFIMDSSNQFATSSIVDGKIYASSFSAPTPSVMVEAMNDMQTAYNDAAGRTNPDHINIGNENSGYMSIGGKTLSPGLYKWDNGVMVLSDVVLSGDSNDVWIFQLDESLYVGPDTRFILNGGAQAKNVFWQVEGSVSLGSNSTFNGNILSKSITLLNDGAKLNGRIFGFGAVLNSNEVTLLTEQTVDRVKPVISIIGTNPITLNLNSNYIDQGATAFDAVSGVIIVISSGTVNTAIIGTYTITYTATDDAGNTQIATRTINVIATPTEPSVFTTITLTPQNANIMVGSSLQMNVATFDQFGLPINTVVSYSSSNRSVAIVNSEGLVSAVFPGRAIIAASSGDKSTTSLIDVNSASPILYHIGSRSVTQGTMLNFTINAVSPHGYNLIFTIIGKPRTASFTGNQDGTATLIWMPILNDVGTTNLGFIVSDGLKSSNEVVSIIVNTLQAPTTNSNNLGNIWENADYNVTLNASEFENNPVAYIRYSLNNISGQINGSFGNVLISTDGNNTLTFYSVDIMGNSETPKTLYYMLDRASPNITSFSLSATSVSVGSIISGTCNATDNLNYELTRVISGIDTSTAGTKTARCIVTDIAGNIATAEATYTVNAISSSSGGGGSSRNIIVTTITDAQFTNGYTKSMSERDVIRFLFDGLIHTLTLKDINYNGRDVTIVVNSTPQTAIIGLGETRQFDLDEDSVNDIEVRLNSISFSSASLTIKKIAILATPISNDVNTAPDDVNDVNTAPAVPAIIPTTTNTITTDEPENAGLFGITGAAIGTFAKKPLTLAVIFFLLIAGAYIFVYTSRKRRMKNRAKNDKATTDRRDMADETTLDNRNRNDEHTEERREKADRITVKSRIRNDE